MTDKKSPFIRADERGSSPAGTAPGAIRLCAAAFIFNEQGEMLLTRQPKWQDKFLIPGGEIRAGESVRQALRREIKEETNLEIHDIEPVNVYDSIERPSDYAKMDKHLVCLNHRARARNPSALRLGKEATEAKWLTPADWVKRGDVNGEIKRIIEKYILARGRDYRQDYLRALADYQNLEKRTAKEKGEFARYANESLLYELLPVYDHLKMALKHAGGQTAENAWREGVRHVAKQFGEVLKASGVEEIETVGKNFDPAEMEAVQGQGEKVKEELKPGYKLNGKVIIPARVVLE